MIVTPKTKPVIENLNSYYVDIKKLFDKARSLKTKEMVNPDE